MEFIPYISNGRHELTGWPAFDGHHFVVAYEAGMSDSFIKQLYTASLKSKFCLLLTGEEKLLQEDLYRIVHIISHPSYWRWRKEPLFFVSKKGKVNDMLQSSLLEQGYRGDMCIGQYQETITKKRSLAVKEFHLLDTSGSPVFNPVQIEYLLHNFPINDYCLVPVKNDSDWEDFSGRFSSFYKQSSFDWYRQTDLLIKEQDQQLEKLFNNLELLKSRNRSYEQYLDYYHENDEGLQVIEFYRTEYEILPLWYKRFGHVIKVLSGKRTFRSLFNKDVKKYRE